MAFAKDNPKNPICSHARAYADAHEELPDELLALLLVRKLMDLRDAGLEKKEADRREAERLRQLQLEKEREEREALQASLRRGPAGGKQGPSSSSSSRARGSRGGRNTSNSASRSSRGNPGSGNPSRSREGGPRSRSSRGGPGDPTTPRDDNDGGNGIGGSESAANNAPLSASKDRGRRRGGRRGNSSSSAPPVPEMDALNDEPESGPDAYIWLRGFPITVSFIQLCFRYAVPLDAIVHLEPYMTSEDAKLVKKIDLNPDASSSSSSSASATASSNPNNAAHHSPREDNSNGIVGSPSRSEFRSESRASVSSRTSSRASRRRPDSSSGNATSSPSDRDRGSPSSSSAASRRKRRKDLKAAAAASAPASSSGSGGGPGPSGPSSGPGVLDHNSRSASGLSLASDQSPPSSSPRADPFSLASKAQAHNILVIPNGSSHALALVDAAVASSPPDSQLRNMVRVSLSGADLKPMLILFDELASRFFDVVAKSKVYAAWRASMDVVPLAPATGLSAVPLSALHPQVPVTPLGASHYVERMNALPDTVPVTPALVLNALVDQVVFTASGTSSVSAALEADYASALQSVLDGPLAHLAGAPAAKAPPAASVSPSMSRSVGPSSGSNSGGGAPKLDIVPWNDTVKQRHWESPDAQKVEQDLIQLIETPVNAAADLEGSGLPSKVRAVEAQTLDAHFLSFPVPVMERTLVLAAFEELLVSAIGVPEWDLSSRTFYEQLTHAELLQVFASIEPLGYTRVSDVYTRDGTLLVAYVPVMDASRSSSSSYTMTVRSPLAFGSFINAVDGNASFFDISPGWPLDADTMEELLDGDGSLHPFVFEPPLDPNAPLSMAQRLELAKKSAAAAMGKSRRRRKETATAVSGAPGGEGGEEASSHESREVTRAYQMSDALVRMAETTSVMYPGEVDASIKVQIRTSSRPPQRRAPVKYLDVSVRHGSRSCFAMHRTLPTPQKPRHDPNPFVPEDDGDDGAGPGAGPHTPSSVGASTPSKSGNPKSSGSASSSSPRKRGPRGSGRDSPSVRSSSNTGRRDGDGGHEDGGHGQGDESGGAKKEGVVVVAKGREAVVPERPHFTWVLEDGTAVGVEHVQDATTVSVTLGNGTRVSTQTGMGVEVVPYHAPTPDSYSAVVASSGSAPVLAWKIGLDGSVTRVGTGGVITVYDPDGGVSVYSALDKMWEYTSSDGAVFSSSLPSRRGAPSGRAPVSWSEHTDPESGTLTRTRADGLVIVKDRATVTSTHVVAFPDGTRIASNAWVASSASKHTVVLEDQAGMEIVVDKAGAGAVVMDVPLARSRVPTVVKLEVDESIIRVRHDDAWLRVEQESDSLFFGSHGVAEYLGTGQKSVTDVYIFSLETGSLHVVDRVRNAFSVDNAGSVSVALMDDSDGLHRHRAGGSDGDSSDSDDDDAEARRREGGDDELLDARMESYRTDHPPRLFVVRPDGTGYEVLEEKVAVAFLERAQDDLAAQHAASSDDSESFAGSFSVEPLAGDSQSTCFTVLAKLPGVRDSDSVLPRRLRQLVRHAQLDRAQRAILFEELDAYEAWQGGRTDSLASLAIDRTLIPDDLEAQAEISSRIVALREAQVKAQEESSVVIGVPQVVVGEHFLLASETDAAISFAPPPGEEQAGGGGGEGLPMYFESAEGIAFLEAQAKTLAREQLLNNVGPGTRSISRASPAESNYGESQYLVFEPLQGPAVVLPSTLRSRVDDDDDSSSDGEEGGVPPIGGVRPGSAAVSEGSEGSAGSAGSEVSAGSTAGSSVGRTTTGSTVGSSVGRSTTGSTAGLNGRRKLRSLQGVRGDQMNTEYMERELPVRRFVKTTSVMQASGKGQKAMKQLFGFELFPEKLDMGVLAVSSVYRLGFSLRNVGVESARFRVKQPSTDGLRVVFKPGPVAPGMLARLEVEFALPGDTSLLGEVLDEVVITTEADVFHVPISARVVTFEEARALFYSSGKQTIAAPGVKRVPVRRSGPPGPSTPSSKRGARTPKSKTRKQWVLPEE